MGNAALSGSHLDQVRPDDPSTGLIAWTPSETQAGGIFHRLHQWLDGNMALYGFYRPYRTRRGGVFPEPWHLSYAPVATVAASLVTLELFEQAVRASTILGRELVLERIEAIYRTYVVNVDAPAFPARQAAA